MLCRARPDSFAQALNSALKQKSIKVRVDVNRRETLSEPVSAILLDIIYAQGGYLEEVVERLAEIITIELAENDWIEVVNAVKGLGAVSIMTMHKSKGLEFHTVIFLGLEDNAIWNYQRNADEETCGLFVALSRAKERCIFTFCRSRPGRYGRDTALVG